MKGLVFLIWMASNSLAQACSNEAIIKHQSGGRTIFYVEIADGIFSRARGLMFREHLRQDAGMLFVYGEEVDLSFWMKNVPIPLDLLFVNSAEEIITIVQNAKPFDESRIKASSSFSSVLEINGGASTRAQIKKGDILTLQKNCE